MASGVLSFDRNISLYTIPAAYVLCLLPNGLSLALAKQRYDIRHPRNLNKTIENDQSLDKATKDRIFRATSASANGIENIGLYAAAIVAGNVAGLAPSLLNQLSIGYVASRVLYNLVYIQNTTPAAAALRSALFWVGTGIYLTLFVMSGNALNRMTSL